MSDRGLKARPWVERAEEDFKIATHELSRGEDAALGGICFHSQQCLEKYLKALLVLHRVDFPKIHDLEILLGMIPKSVLNIPVDDVLPLNRYSIEGRYPGDWELPSRKEAEEALELMTKSRDAIRKCLPNDALERG